MNKEEYIKIQENRSAKNDFRYMSPWGKKFLEEYIDQIEPPVLEIGCGNGPLLEHLNKKGIFSIGVDISRPSVWHAINHKFPVPAICQDAQQELPFPDNTFKTAITFHTLEHSQSPRLTIKNIDKVLNGTLYVIFPLGGIEENFGHFANIKTIDEAKRLFRGFKIEHIDQNKYRGCFFIASNKKHEKN